jgi:hypothetical protein
MLFPWNAILCVNGTGKKSKQNKLRGLSPEKELYRPSDRRLSTKLVSTFVGRGLSRGQHNGSLRPYSRFYRQKPLFFLSSSSTFVLTRLTWPFPDSLLLRKSGSAGNRTRNIWICSQKLWPQDYRGGQNGTGKNFNSLIVCQFNIAFMRLINTNRSTDSDYFRLSDMCSSSRAIAIFVIARDNAVGVAIGYGLDDRGGQSSSAVRVKNFVFPTSFRPVLGPPSHVCNGYRRLSPQSKAADAWKVDHSPPTSAEVKKTWICTSTPLYVFMT